MPATNSIHQRQPTGLHREKFLLRQLLVSKHFCLTTRRALKRAPRVGVRVEHEILRMMLTNLIYYVVHASIRCLSASSAGSDC